MRLVARNHEWKPENVSPASDDVFSGFGRIMTGYASLLAVIAASIPAPATWLDTIPVYHAQRGYLGLYSGAAGAFILVSAMFARDRVAQRTKFPTTSFWSLSLAVLLILGCIACIACYHYALSASVEEVIDAARQLGTSVPETMQAVLMSTDGRLIPNALLLSVLYLGIFVFAEAAFALFALKEYIQRALRIKEADLLSRRN